MRYRSALLAGVLAALMAPIAVAQVPPPPPSNDQSSIISSLIFAIQNKDIDSYSRLLDDNVNVFTNGEKTAGNKSQWLAIIRKSFANDGVIYAVKSAYPSNGGVLFIEYFNSAASFGGGPPADCCWRYDAVSYRFSNGKISSISKLEGGAQDVLGSLKPKKGD